MSTLNELTAEYAAYCEEHGLSKMSADELLVEMQVKRDEATEPFDKHVSFLLDFSRRWEAAEEDESRIAQLSEEENAFQAWRETRRYTTTLGEDIGEADLPSEHAFIYEGNVYIGLVGRDSECAHEGTFHLVLGRDEKVSFDIEPLERELFQFFKDTR